MRAYRGGVKRKREREEKKINQSFVPDNIFINLAHFITGESKSSTTLHLLLFFFQQNSI